MDGVMVESVGSEWAEELREGGRVGWGELGANQVPTSEVPDFKMLSGDGEGEGGTMFVGESESEGSVSASIA